jgi:hypothetical protein
MTEHCIDAPISWLRLERYALGELPEAPRREVEAHLAACPVCRACAEEVRRPRALPPLPLPIAGPAFAPARTPRRPIRRARPRVLVTIGSALAIAAAVALFFAPGRDEHGSTPLRAGRSRGGDVAMVLLRARGGSVIEDPDVFAEDDRFKVLVTCPPGHDDRFAVWVVQGEERSLALRAEGRACGNRVALPGAFRITGATETKVCVAYGPDALRFQDGTPFVSPSTLETSAVCRTLRPAPKSP